jgi:hypothetical protein
MKHVHRFGNQTRIATSNTAKDVERQADEMQASG